MTKSLYDVLVQVKDAYDKVAEHTSVDIAPALKRIYREHNSNPLVNAVMQGRTSFVGELIKYAKGGTTNKEYLAQALGRNLPNVSMDRWDVVGFAGIGGLIGLSRSSDEDISRRDIFKVGVGALSGAALGTGVAAVKKEMSIAWLVDYFEKAQFLDNTYRKVA